MLKLLESIYSSNDIITKDNKSVILSSFTVLTSVILVINLIYIFTATSLILSRSESKLDTTLADITSNNEQRDYTFIANFTNAKTLQIVLANGDCLYFKHIGSVLVPTPKYEPRPLIGSESLYTDWYLTDKLDIVMRYPVPALLNYKSKIINIELAIPVMIINNIFFNLLVTVVFLISSYIMTLSIVSKVRISELISKAGNEALLSSKNTQRFTEAMHHEVKTPLAILNSSFDKTENLLEDLWSNIDNPDYIRKRLVEDRDSIRTLTERVDLNFGIIYNILDKQRNNRAIRYSNGNYNLYDLIQHSFEGLKWDTKIKYIYNIDDRLKLISNSTTGLSNENFTSIMTNHIRNSLEANSNNIKVVLNYIDDNVASIYIADNGKGMSEKVKDMVYSPNFSTKKELKNSDNQGIGMYLCQTLLAEVKGFEVVQSSSCKGTVFELVFPIMQYNGKL